LHILELALCTQWPFVFVGVSIGSICNYRIVVVFDVDIIIKTIGVGFLRHMPRAVDFSLVFNAI